MPTLIQLRGGSKRPFFCVCYDGPTLVVRSEDRDLGWSDVLTGPVEMADVPGGHNTMLKAPYVAALGATLDRFLDAASA